MLDTTEDRLEFSHAKDLLVDFQANPSNFASPYPIYRAVRDVEPVHWSETGTWLVLGHPEGQEALRHPALSVRVAGDRFLARFGGEQTASSKDALAVWGSSFFMCDGLEHARVRLLIQHAFSPKAILQWETTIVRCITELVEELRGRDEFDLLHDYAYRIPSAVIADILGVPRGDHQLFEKWTAGWYDIPSLTDPRAVYDSSVVKPLEEFIAYIRALIEDRRSRPTEDNLLGFLLSAEEKGDTLSEYELISTILQIIIAGHETTANLISNGYLSLLRNTPQLEALAADPGLIAWAVEECLRYETPSRTQARVAAEDISIGGVAIKKGQAVQTLAGAANHDGRVFERPDEMDITRKPNGHISFGFGAHNCIGMHIARLEARHAINALVNDVGPLRIAGDIQWRGGIIRGLVGFPVRRA